MSAGPIVPAESARSLTQRTLQTPDVADTLMRMGMAASNGWSLDALTVAAWSLRSDIRVAEADIETGLKRGTRGRPDPEPDVGNRSELVPDEQSGRPDRLGLSAALNFVIETGRQARNPDRSSPCRYRARRWHLSELFWQARAELRRAVAARDIANRSIVLADEELRLRADYLDWVETQIRFGIGIGADRLTAQTNLSRAQAQLRTARGDLAAAEAQIAAAEGIAIENCRCSK
jgi:outer membrane protein TolC